MRESELSKFKLHYEYNQTQIDSWVVKQTNKILSYIEEKINKLIDRVVYDRSK